MLRVVTNESAVPVVQTLHLDSAKHAADRILGSGVDRVDVKDGDTIVYSVSR